MALEADTEALKNRSRIRELFSNSLKCSSFPITLLYRSNSSNETFFLICAPRTAKKAVTRNRIKRRIREMIRLRLDEIPKGLDLAIIGQLPVADWEFEKLLISLDRCLVDLKLRLQKE